MVSRRQFLISAAAVATSGFGLPAFASDPFAPVVARLHGMVKAGELPFASIRIAQHGQVLAEAHISGVERIGSESVYRIYSMTKPVVAAAVVMLVAEGRLGLEDPVAKFVPEFADLTVVGDSLQQPEVARPMTVAQLLTHTCGLANSWGDARIAPLYREAGLTAGAWMYDPQIGGLAGFAKRLAAQPLEFQPGSDWMYGYGLDIAGLVIERLSGERLGDFLKQRLFDPMGMASTGFFVPEPWAKRLAGLYAVREGGLQAIADGSAQRPLIRPLADSGSGGLVSTLEDYGRFADMLANGGVCAGVRVMGADAVRTLVTPYGPQQALMPSLLRFGRYAHGSVGHALGGIVRIDDRSGPGSTGEYAWGGAAGTGFWVTPGLGLSVTVMTQLMPAMSVSARDVLRPMVYDALASGS